MRVTLPWFTGKVSDGGIASLVDLDTINPPSRTVNGKYTAGPGTGEGMSYRAVDGAC